LQAPETETGRWQKTENPGVERQHSLNAQAVERQNQRLERRGL